MRCGVSADESRNIGAAVISVAGVEHEMNQLRIGLGVKSFDFADLRLELPPVVVVSNGDANALREAARGVESFDLVLQAAAASAAGRAAEDEVLGPQRRSAARHRLVNRRRRNSGCRIVHFKARQKDMNAEECEAGLLNLAASRVRLSNWALTLRKPDSNP